MDEQPAQGNAQQQPPEGRPKGHGAPLEGGSRCNLTPVKAYRPERCQLVAPIQEKAHHREPKAHHGDEYSYHLEGVGDREGLVKDPQDLDLEVPVREDPKSRMVLLDPKPQGLRIDALVHEDRDMRHRVIRHPSAEGTQVDENRAPLIAIVGKDTRDRGGVPACGGRDRKGVTAMKPEALRETLAHEAERLVSGRIEDRIGERRLGPGKVRMNPGPRQRGSRQHGGSTVAQVNAVGRERLDLSDTRGALEKRDGALGNPVFRGGVHRSRTREVQVGRERARDPARHGFLEARDKDRHARAHSHRAQEGGSRKPVPARGVGQMSHRNPGGGEPAADPASQSPPGRQERGPDHSSADDPGERGRVAREREPHRLTQMHGRKSRQEDARGDQRHAAPGVTPQAGTRLRGPRSHKDLRRGSLRCLAGRPPSGDDAGKGPESQGEPHLGGLEGDGVDGRRIIEGVDGAADRPHRTLGSHPPQPHAENASGEA